MKIDNRIERGLAELEERIKTEDISKAAQNTREWAGADVIISRTIREDLKRWAERDRHVISFQKTAPRRRLVITEHAKELSWLFLKLQKIFSGRIDYASKYDFYGSLAQAALDCLEESKGKADQKTLLLRVLDAAKKFEALQK